MYRRIQVHLALFDQLHQQQRREGFGDGANLKQGVFSDGQGVIYIRHAKWQDVGFAILPHTHDCTGNVMLGHCFGGKLC